MIVVYIILKLEIFLIVWLSDSNLGIDEFCFVFRTTRGGGFNVVVKVSYSKLYKNI